MSDIETLQKEIETLKQQAINNSQGVNGLLAQLDAHKNMLSESITSVLHLRTNLILFEKSNKEIAERNSELKKSLEEAHKRIAELELAQASL